MNAAHAPILLRALGRDDEALEAFKLCARLEGILPALEPAGDEVPEIPQAIDLGEPAITGIVSPVRLAYQYAASPEESLSPVTGEYP